MSGVALSFHQFCLQMGVGILAMTLLVPYRELGGGFFLLQSLLSGIFLFLVLILQLAWGEGASAELIASCVAVIVAIGLFRMHRGQGVVLLGAAFLLGFFHLLRQASAGIGEGIPPGTLHWWTRLLSPAASAWVLGSVMTAMILGHFYLVIPQLSFIHLRRLTALFGVSILFRLGLIGAALYADPGDVWLQWQRGIDPVQMVFLSLRVLFGLAAPGVLAWMAWDCVRIRSNQSATGILYAATVLVLIGEIAAQYVQLQYGLPV